MTRVLNYAITVTLTSMLIVSAASPIKADRNTTKPEEAVQETSIVLAEARVIDAGFDHTCALDTEGRVKCWGANHYGQLGDGTTVARNIPVEVIGLDGEAQTVSAGLFHTCAVSIGGQIKCWGWNGAGQLGDGTTADRHNPVNVTGLGSEAEAVSVGGYHTCALTSSGGVKCWGWNFFGQLGDGTRWGRSTPVDVQGLESGVRAISSGATHTCALTSGGGMKCWGSNYRGQLGNGRAEDFSTVPEDVYGLGSGIVAISAGANHSCAVTADGAAKCWGANHYGHMGDGTTVDRYTPVDVAVSTGVRGISAGQAHTCAVTTSGGAKCWGANFAGEVGDGTSGNYRSVPADVIDLDTGVLEVTTGGAGLAPGGSNHSCALLAGGGMKCWGANYHGQLGDGTSAFHRPAPVTVIGFGNPQDMPIVLLPGIMGSRLDNEPNSSDGACLPRPAGEVWPNLLRLSQQLPHSHNDFLETLYLTSDGSRSAHPCDDISPNGIIDKISLFGMDFYASFIDSLRSDGYTVDVFPYDWRLDLRKKPVESLHSHLSINYPDTKVVLIGHSMGGLLAREYIRQFGSERVAKIITVSTPYLGAPKAAYTMRSGTLDPEVWLDLDLIADDDVIREINRNAPGANQLLPSRGYVQQAGWYYRDDQTALQTYEETHSYLEKMGQNGPLMDEAQEFHESIENFSDISTPYYIVATNHLPTPLRIREYTSHRLGFLSRTRVDIIGWASGDRTVPWISARLRGLDGDWSGNAIVCTDTALNENDYEHAQILRNSAIQYAVRSILLDLLPFTCLETQAQSAQLSTTFDIRRVTVWGPARVTITDSEGRFNGPTPDGLLATNIPGSTYQIVGDGTFIMLTPADTYTVTLDFDGDLPVEIYLTDIVVPVEGESTISQSVVFNQIPSADGGKAAFIYDPLASAESYQVEIDLDSDNVLDESRPPDAVLSGAEASDIIPPTTQVTISGTQDSLGFYTGPVTVTLNATDDLAGVLRIEYSLDGGMTGNTYSDPFTIIAEDVPILYAQAVDRAGNAEFPWATARLRPHNLHLPLVSRQ